MKKRIFVKNYDNKIVSHNVYYDEEKFVLLLDKITRKLGCKYNDISATEIYISSMYKNIDKAYNARKECLKKGYSYVKVHKLFGKDKIEKVSSLYRYYYDEDDFVLSLAHCHNNKSIPCYDMFTIFPVEYLHYPNVINYLDLYNYLNENTLTDKIKDYLRSYVQLLNIDYKEHKVNREDKDLNNLIRFYKYDYQASEIANINNKVLTKIKKL